MKPESAKPSDYLAATEVVTADDPLIAAQARELITGASTDVEQARRLFEWVRDQIPHTNDLGSEVVTCTASEVLRQGTGICYAKSHLLAALCRSIDLPAGFCYQKLRKDPPYEGFELHGFNAIYLASLGRWVQVDARGNKPGVAAEFSGDEERLAFQADPSRGEVTYPGIWISPLPSVVALLSRPGNLSQLWAELPDEAPMPG